MTDIAGRVALVTGGASGIGYALAEALLAAGARVAIADIDAAALDEAVARLGGGAIGVGLDITRAEAWEAALARIDAALGPVSLLFNNAGLGQGRKADGGAVLAEEMPEAVWRLVIETNLTGTFLGVRAALPRLRAAGGGHIVNTASMAGFIAPGGLSAYAASKYAVVGLSESLRAELAPHGIGVSVLCPGAVSTNFYRTSAVRRDAIVDAETSRAFAPGRTDMAARMVPANLAAHVLRAVEANALYIFTHPEYQPLVGARFEAVRRAFGGSAQPGYRDPDLVLDRSANPEYVRAPAAKES